MNAAAWIFLPGFVLELCGLFIVAASFIDLWQTFSGGERFTGPLAARVAQFARLLVDAIRETFRRLLRRPHHVLLSDGGSGGVTIGTSRDRVVIDFGPLPSITESPEAFAGEVEQRLQRLMRDVQDAAERARFLVEVESGQRQRADAELAAGQSQLNTQLRDLAIGDLHRQVIGWGLVLAGFTVQAISNLMTLGH